MQKYTYENNLDRPLEGQSSYHKEIRDMTLKAATFKTMLGPMVAIADNDLLYALHFVKGGRMSAIGQRIMMSSTILVGDTPITSLVQHELALYFQGMLEQFTTPLSLFLGTSFQESVWKQLCLIPYGTTCSYTELAQAIEKPSACRAVARANSENPFSIIVPCHRVIRSDGTCGGYAGGLDRKKRLIEHEYNVRSVQGTATLSLR